MDVWHSSWPVIPDAWSRTHDIPPISKRRTARISAKEKPREHEYVLLWLFCSFFCDQSNWHQFMTGLIFHFLFSGKKKVQEAGLEPAQYCYHRHLKPARLPIPPFLHLLIFNVVCVFCRSQRCVSYQTFLRLSTVFLKFFVTYKP